MTLAILTNSDVAVQPIGSVVRQGLLANTCLLAQADTLNHGRNLLGVRLADVAAGAGGTVARLTCGTSVALDNIVSAGDAIYLSAATAGRGTGVAPLLRVFLGYAYDVRLIGGTYYASLITSVVVLRINGTVLPAQLPGTIIAQTYIFPPVDVPEAYSGVHTLNPRARSFSYWMTAGGGAGGGAVGGSAGNISVGSGGGGGGYQEGVVTVVPGVTSLAWVIGQGGVAVLGGTGETGGSSTLTYNGTVIATCTGGTGGQVMTSGNTPATINGGTLGNSTPSTNIVITGSNGTSGMRWSGTVGLAGMGGTTGKGAWSGGSSNEVCDGERGLRHGGGGAGAFAATVNQTGGVGRSGGLVIREFT